MTLPIERARSRRPITWLTIIGVLLLPAIVGGILVAALQNPTERLVSMTAAVVNLDDPVTIDGQYTPLGRQLAAGLVEGSDEMDSNLTWVISNEDDAAEGMSDGRYQAIITIPESFSADATSSGAALQGDEEEAQQAEITVTTPPDGRVADGMITQQIASVAASTMGTMLSEATVGNVLVGFTTLGEQIGEAADGASELADGAQSAADGAAEIPAGATGLADGANGIASGANGLADGANGIAYGANGLADGASQLAGGLGTISGKTREAGAGATQLGQGLNSGAATLEQNGLVPDELFGAADAAVTASNGAAQAAGGAEQASAGVRQGIDTLAPGLRGLADSCDATANPDFCAQLAVMAGTAEGLQVPAATAADLSAQAAQAAAGASQASAGTAQGLRALDAQAPKALADQMRTAGTAAIQLGTGLGQLADGVSQSATGATDLAGGATQLGDGAGQLGDGASQLSDGATQLSDGATALGEGADELATGIDSLASGTDELADGLHTATSSLPSFDDEQSTSLASVIANPVTSNSDSDAMFGPTTIPLLAVVVLWFGALASFIALRAVPGSALTSRRSSAGMVLRGFWPAAAIGAGQGILVALIVQIVAGYDAAAWWGFAGFAVVAGVAFAAINQALLAVLGGIGRWISALVGVLALATGLISTIPDWLAGLGAALPTSPALAGLVEPSGAAAAGLIVWGVLSLGAATLSVATRRTTSAKAALAAV